MYICSKCNKNYKSYMGFWLHNKKYHINTNNTNNTNNTESNNI